jgi:hypothetical protein
MFRIIFYIIKNVHFFLEKLRVYIGPRLNFLIFAIINGYGLI